MKPHRPINDLTKMLEKTFQKWKRFLPEGKNKFSKVVKTLLLAADIQTKISNPLKSRLAGKPFWDGLSFVHTPRNLVDVCNGLKIEVIRTAHFCYVRDHFLSLKDLIAISHSSPYLEEAAMRTYSSNVYLGRIAASFTANQYFNTWSGYTRSYDGRIYQESEKLFKSPPKSFSYTYLEGGNVFILTNQKGEVKALVGADHLLQTFHLLELEGHSWSKLAESVLQEKSFEELKEEIYSSLSQEQTKLIAEEMFAQGLLLQNGRTGVIPYKDQLDIMMIKFFAQNKLPPLNKDQNLHKLIAITKGVIPSFEFPSNEEKKYAQLVADYLAKIEITKKIIAKELGLISADVHYILQVNYHLDLFITPGPSDSIFLNSFLMCRDVFESIEKEAEKLNLSEMDQQHLKRYIATSKKLDVEIGGLLKIVENQLKEAGFEVLPMPGNLMYESETMYQEFPMPSGGFNANFMNALTGYSQVTGKDFYITHGLQVGDRLGNVIMDAFELYLRGYMPDIEVYFIGRDPENLSDFSEAMDWWNRLETQSGVHCTTFEVE